MTQPELPELAAYHEAQVTIENRHFPQIEQWLWSDTQNQAVIYHPELDGPIPAVRVSLDGSNKADGNFGIAARLSLGYKPPEDGVLDEEGQALISFLESFADRHNGHPIEDDRFGYIISWHDHTKYWLRLVPDLSAFELTTCHVGGYNPVTKDSIASLRHGQDQSISRFSMYLTMLRELMTDYYEARGFNDKVLLKTHLSALSTLSDSNRPPSDDEERPYPKMEDVGGLAYPKRVLQEFAEEFQHPEVLRRYGIAPRQGVFLYGPGGTGKTLLAEAFQHEIGADMIRLSAADIYNMWLGNSEKAIKEVFGKAEEVTKPTIVYFNEIDGIITPKGGSTDARVAAIFKQGAEAIGKNPLAILWADTNKNLDEMDQAIVRSGRFDIRLHIPLPDREALADILGNMVFRHFVDSEREVFAPGTLDFGSLASEADGLGLTGADLKNILQGIIARHARMEIRTSQEPPPVTQDELSQAITAFRTR